MINASAVNTLNQVPLVNSTQLITQSAQVPQVSQIPVAASTPIVSQVPVAASTPMVSQVPVATAPQPMVSALPPVTGSHFGTGGDTFQLSEYPRNPRSGSCQYNGQPETWIVSSPAVRAYTGTLFRYTGIRGHCGREDEHPDLPRLPSQRCQTPVCYHCESLQYKRQWNDHRDPGLHLDRACGSLTPHTI